MANSANIALAAAALQKGLGFVPDRGEYGAPSTFRGDSDQLDSFLRKVEKIIAAHSITTSAEKVKALYTYLGGEPRQFFRDHAAFKEGKYDAMVSALREAYPTRKHRFKYTTSDLDKVARRQRKKKMRTIEEA
ncbi:hypothetical protein A4X13_0g9270, partial [Tilletia indica]